jgi:ectoine hydroxylase-related dioxygenase (phytanoyl-CoA dioxygenase family)
MESYGVLKKENLLSKNDNILEEIKKNGFSIINSAFSKDKIEKIKSEFVRIQKQYIDEREGGGINEIQESNIIRLPMSYDSSLFIELALNSKILKIVQSLLLGKFILNQQNGIINPPRNKYSQGRWHRDLPYQHFISSRPIAISAIYCVDDFNYKNGATYFLPHSHRYEKFPSENFIENNAIQLEVKKGEFIIFDSMLYHSGGFNKSSKPRRAINHVYTIPFFKQQINIPFNINLSSLSSQEKEILGLGFEEPKSINEFFNQRKKI